MIQDAIQAWRHASPQDKIPLRNELVKKYTPLIKLVALRIIRKLPPHIELGDLINTGVLGLMDAIEKFDPDRKIKFETYAEFRIRGAILDELRSLDWVPRSIRQRLNELEKTMEELESKLGRPPTGEETAEGMQISREELFKLINQANGVNLISLDELGFSSKSGPARRNFLEFFREPHQESIIDILNIKEVKGIVAKAIEELPENERRVVSMYYFDELTMKEIGLVLGITESRISQIHNKVILRLRAKLKHNLKEEN